MRYFPPLDQPTRSKIRQTVKASSNETEAHKNVAELCQKTDQLTPFSTEFTDQFAIVSQAGVDIHFPRGIPPIKFVLIAYNYVEWLKRKYSLPGFCEVEDGDIVFDCGAYVGGFSMAAASVAKAVYSFEPAPNNFQCIEKCVTQFPNIHACAMGLGKQNETLELNLSRSSVEHSFLAPDRGGVAGRIEVDVRTIETFVSDNNLGSVDFLKIEAEGFEIEVFQGLGKVRPKKIAIDVSPERDLESPSEFFEKELLALGYETQRRGNVLFGVLA